MEAALEQRPLIEGSATEVDSTTRPPAESGNAPAPAEQAAVAANQSAALPAMKDVMSQPAVKRAMPAIVALLSLLVGADFLVNYDLYALSQRVRWL
jgi:hypothetical protein